MSAVALSAVASFLRSLTLFSGLSEGELARLVEMGQELDVPAGQVLMREGEPGDALYVILDGHFEVTNRAGKAEVVVARRGTGEVIGEMSLLDNQPRSATVRALAPSHLFKVDQHAFDELLARNPDTTHAILKTVASRLRNTEAMLLQAQKMAALGTLSAGIAHELNNPAAAVQRAARQLAEELRAVERLEAQFNATSPSEQQRAEFARLRDEVESRPRDRVELDPLTRSDLEGAVQDWLDERGVGANWEVGPRLVEMGFSRERLEALSARFSAEQLEPVLGWLGARSAVDGLLGEIASGAARLSDIVKAVKSYSYLDRAAIQEVDVHEGLEDTLIILRYKLKQGITIQREYDRSLPKIEAYAGELNQVWTNIIDNAIDAMQGRGTLTLRTFAEGERVSVEICDSGPGIPPEIQERIFEPFFTTKPVGSGTGLGLHISYNIVVLKHRGQITVRSHPGGTCFKVSLAVRIPKDE